MSEPQTTDFERVKKVREVIPEPIVMPDGMLQCRRCNETFSEMDLYEDHYAEAHMRERAI